MSKHEVLVIKVDNINVCPNADSLEIINIWDYQCVVRKGQYKIGDLIAFIEPDYEVPLDRDEFKFLDEKKKGGMLRITIRKFRKNVSYGLIIPAPEGSIENENVMEILGVKRWEPSQIQDTGAEANMVLLDLFRLLQLISSPMISKM